MAKLTKAQAGALGGKMTRDRHGRAHFQAAGRKGAAVTWQRYNLVPIGTNEFVMVDRVTGQIKARHT